MHCRDATGIEEPLGQLGGRIIGLDLVAHLVADVTHPGEAAIQLETQDARTGRRCRDEGDRLSHSASKTSDSASARPTSQHRSR